MSEIQDELERRWHFKDEADYVDGIVAWAKRDHRDDDAEELADTADRLRAMPEQIERLLRRVDRKAYEKGTYRRFDNKQDERILAALRDERSENDDDRK